MVFELVLKNVSSHEIAVKMSKIALSCADSLFNLIPTKKNIAKDNHYSTFHYDGRFLVKSLIRCFATRLAAFRLAVPQAQTMLYYKTHVTCFSTCNSQAEPAYGRNSCWRDHDG